MSVLFTLYIACYYYHQQEEYTMAHLSKDFSAVHVDMSNVIDETFDSQSVSHVQLSALLKQLVFTEAPPTSKRAQSFQPSCNVHD